MRDLIQIKNPRDFDLETTRRRTCDLRRLEDLWTVQSVHLGLGATIWSVPEMRR
jgi:hypothetical protein